MKDEEGNPLMSWFFGLDLPTPPKPDPSKDVVNIGDVMKIALEGATCPTCGLGGGKDVE